MNINQAIDSLKNNHKNKYETELTSGETATIFLKDGELFINLRQNLSGTVIKIPLDAEWKPIRESVTWQKALQAWADGKIIECEFNDGEHISLYPYSELPIINRYLMKGIKTGIWYIEEGEPNA